MRNNASPVRGVLPGVVDGDLRLEALGAKRLHSRMDCDVVFDKPAQSWMRAVLPLIAAGAAVFRWLLKGGYFFVSGDA